MADQRIQSTEKMVGAGHATLADTLNRLALVEHNNDGTHNPALIPLSQKGAANGVASLDAGGAIPDAQIPAAIARDSEVITVITNHEAAADPHTGYQKESEKGAASGYASLDTATKVPTAQLGGAGADNTKFLRGDQSWIALDHGLLTGLADDDHTQYFLANGTRNMAGNLQLAGNSLLGNSTASGNLQLNSTSNATKGKILFGANSAFDEVNVEMGLGATSSPYAAIANRGFFVAKENIPVEVTLYSFTGGGINSGYRFVVARGTKTSPSATQAGDGGFFAFTGYGTTDYASVGSSLIKMIAAENFTDSARGAYISFEITPIGSTTRAERVRITDVGNVKIAGTANRATTEGTAHIDIFNGTPPAGTLANGISIYSSAGECYIMDAAGNATLQSPHDKDGNWIFYSKNSGTGKVLKIHMEKLMRKLDEMFGGGFIEEFLT